MGKHASAFGSVCLCVSLWHYDRSGDFGVERPIVDLLHVGMKRCFLCRLAQANASVKTSTTERRSSHWSLTTGPTSPKRQVLRGPRTEWPVTRRLVAGTTRGPRNLTCFPSPFLRPK
ncbi:hypothetical protein BHE74_00007760 [Ensete ventricosum]|nr:hypothetical protein BHE74_00007760 [Ensete ventricosum]